MAGNKKMMGMSYKKGKGKVTIKKTMKTPYGSKKTMSKTYKRK